MAGKPHVDERGSEIAARVRHAGAVGVGDERMLSAWYDVEDHVRAHPAVQVGSRRPDRVVDDRVRAAAHHPDPGGLDVAERSDAAGVRRALRVGQHAGYSRAPLARAVVLAAGALQLGAAVRRSVDVAQAADAVGEAAAGHAHIFFLKRPIRS